MKLPSNARRVFKGVINEVWQWEQLLYDGTTTTFELIKRPDTVLVVGTHEDKLIISYQEQPDKPPYYSFLGGRSEEGEGPLRTAQRELLEEGGLTSDEFELVKVYDNFSKYDWEIYLYVARNCRKIQEPELDGGEKVKLMYVEFDEFIDYLCHDDFWGGEITLDILKIKQDPKKLEEFKDKLFGRK